MTKDEYLWMVAHYFRIEQLFRIIQEWFGSNKGNDTWDINKEAFATLLQNSHQHYPVLTKTSTEINRLKCLQLRLDNSTAKRIYRSNLIPVVSKFDDLRYKFIRFAHEKPGTLSLKKGIHHSIKTTKS